MGRLCERPGCSEDAAVVYGMDPVDLVFWLDALSVRHGVDARVLCRRHADSMVVPRGWTLDDLRDPDLRLFRPPVPDSPAQERSRRRTGRSPAGGEQLALGDDDAFEIAPAATPVGSAPAGDRPATARGADGEGEPVGTDSIDSTDTGAEAEPAAPWMPEFDADDDLGGLLSARSPLLARAFRGADRPR